MPCAEWPFWPSTPGLAGKGHAVVQRRAYESTVAHIFSSCDDDDMIRDVRELLIIMKTKSNIRESKQRLDFTYVYFTTELYYLQ
eukprot:1184809-Prorocentrum_minimum.AAC.1